MANHSKLIQSVIAAFLTITTSQSAFSASSNITDAPTEKCYGISKAASNDCATATASCAGSAKKDNEPDAFLLMPKGLCDKIVGSHLKPNSK